MTIVETSAPDVRVMFLLGIMLLAFLSLDIFMVVSLLRHGDEQDVDIVEAVDLPLEVVGRGVRRAVLELAERHDPQPRRARRYHQ